MEPQTDITPTTETAEPVVVPNPYNEMVYKGPAGSPREVLFYPDERLQKPSRDAVTADQEMVRTLAADMVATCKAAGAAGLAAIQLGVPLNVIVVGFGGDDFAALVNPRIVFRSDDKRFVSEGCLSFPRVFEQVERHTCVKVLFQDLDGAEREMTLTLDTGDKDAPSPTGPACHAVQHEVEHLQGILLVDHLQVHRKMKVKTHMKQVNRRTSVILQKSGGKLTPTQAVFGYAPVAPGAEAQQAA